MRNRRKRRFTDNIFVNTRRRPGGNGVSRAIRDPLTTTMTTTPFLIAHRRPPSSTCLYGCFYEKLQSLMLGDNDGRGGGLFL